MTRVLVLNAGSSSLKASLLEADTPEPIAVASVEWGSDATRTPNRRQTLEKAVSQLGISDAPRRPDVVGHRVVHGGARFRQPTPIDDEMLRDLDSLTELAPLHNGVAVSVIRAQRELLPDVPAVAVFDTAFHSSLAEDAYVLPLPWDWYADWGVRQFGFHGLSVEWSMLRAAELLGEPPETLSLIVAHLGNGCSVTAVENGHSVWTSMGFTPLAGLAMGTRSGSVDPGVLLYALRQRGLTADQLAEVLDHRSGLLGISGSSGDVRQLLAAAAEGDHRAQLALDVFVRRAAEGVAAGTASLNRLDALVFTGGIGEHAASIRSAITGHLATLGVPHVAADDVAGDGFISDPASSPAVLRIKAREDLVIARRAAAVMSQGKRKRAG